MHFLFVSNDLMYVMYQQLCAWALHLFARLSFLRIQVMFWVKETLTNGRQRPCLLCIYTSFTL